MIPFAINILTSPIFTPSGVSKYTQTLLSNKLDGGGGDAVTLLKLKSKEEAVLIARALVAYGTPETNELFIKICDRLDINQKEVEDDD